MNGESSSQVTITQDELGVILVVPMPNNSVDSSTPIQCSYRAIEEKPNNEKAYSGSLNGAAKCTETTKRTEKPMLKIANFAVDPALNAPKNSDDTNMSPPPFTLSGFDVKQEHFYCVYHFNLPKVRYYRVFPSHQLKFLLFTPGELNLPHDPTLWKNVPMVLLPNPVNPSMCKIDIGSISIMANLSENMESFKGSILKSESSIISFPTLIRLLGQENDHNVPRFISHVVYAGSIVYNVLYSSFRIVPLFSHLSMLKNIKAVGHRFVRKETVRHLKLYFEQRGVHLNMNQLENWVFLQTKSKPEEYPMTLLLVIKTLIRYINKKSKQSSLKTQIQFKFQLNSIFGSQNAKNQVSSPKDDLNAKALIRTFNSSIRFTKDITGPLSKTLDHFKENRPITCFKCSSPFKTFNDLLNHLSTNEYKGHLGSSVPVKEYKEGVCFIKDCSVPLDYSRNESYIHIGTYHKQVIQIIIDDLKKKKTVCPYKGCSNKEHKLEDLWMHITEGHLAKPIKYFIYNLQKVKTLFIQKCPFDDCEADIKEKEDLELHYSINHNYVVNLLQLAISDDGCAHQDMEKTSAKLLLTYRDMTTQFRSRYICKLCSIEYELESFFEDTTSFLYHLSSRHFLQKLKKYLPENFIGPICCPISACNCQIGTIKDGAIHLGVVHGVTLGILKDSTETEFWKPEKISEISTKANDPQCLQESFKEFTKNYLIPTKINSQYLIRFIEYALLKKPDLLTVEVAKYFIYLKKNIFKDIDVKCPMLIQFLVSLKNKPRKKILNILFIRNKVRNPSSDFSVNELATYTCCEKLFTHTIRLEAHLETRTHSEASVILNCVACDQKYSVAVADKNSSTMIKYHTFTPGHLHNRWLFTNTLFSENRKEPVKHLPNKCCLCKSDTPFVCSASHSQSIKMLETYVLFCDMRNISPKTCTILDLCNFLEFIYRSPNGYDSPTDFLSLLSSIHDSLNGNQQAILESKVEVLISEPVNRVEYVCFSCPFLSSDLATFLDHGESLIHKTACMRRSQENELNLIRCEKCHDIFDETLYLKLHAYSKKHLSFKNDLKVESSSKNYCNLCQIQLKLINLSDHLSSKNHQVRARVADKYLEYCTDESQNPYSAPHSVVKTFVEHYDNTFVAKLTTLDILRNLHGSLKFEVDKEVIAEFGPYTEYLPHEEVSSVSKCPVCCEEFAFATPMLYHLLEVHNQKPSWNFRSESSSILCKTCFKTFSCPLGFAVHQDRHLLVATKIIDCIYCLKRYPSPFQYYSKDNCSRSCNFNQSTKEESDKEVLEALVKLNKISKDSNYRPISEPTSASSLDSWYLQYPKLKTHIPMIKLKRITHKAVIARRVKIRLYDLAYSSKFGHKIRKQYKVSALKGDLIPWKYLSEQKRCRKCGYKEAETVFQMFRHLRDYHLTKKSYE